MDYPQQDDECYTCGSADSKDFICSCSRCGYREHIWCMRILLKEMPDTWVCHDCQRQDSSDSPTQIRGVSIPGSMTPRQSPLQSTRRMKDQKHGKVKFLPTSEAAGLLPGDGRNCMLPVQNSPRKLYQHRNTNTPIPSRITSPIKPSAPVRDFCQLAEDLRETRGRNGTWKKIADAVKPSNRQISSSTPADGAPERKVNECDHESIDKVKTRELAIIEKLTKNPVKTNAIWRGQLEILSDPLDHRVYSGLQAYTPNRIPRKALLFSSHLPSLLCFKLVSRNTLWPETFTDCPPDENDVALYMFPEILDRCRQSYKLLMDMLDSGDYALHTFIDGVELILSTTKWLKITYKGSERQNFLWGFYRVHNCGAMHKEPSITFEPKLQEEKVKESNNTSGEKEEMNVDVDPKVHEAIVKESNITYGGNENEITVNVDAVDMELDMIDGEWIGPEEVIVPKEIKPILDETTRKVINQSQLEYPPGFESQHWWKNRNV